MRILIYNGIVVNENSCNKGYIVVKDDKIECVSTLEFSADKSIFDKTIDAKGGYIMPGVIDDQVHFREPGLTYKADIHSESRAAVAGGVTSFMEMPNTKPPATTIELLDEKFNIAANNSLANYSFYLGATNDNIAEIERIDTSKVCGVKVFMGSSTGNMLVDSDEALRDIFSNSPVIVAVHAEQESIVQANIAKYKELYGDNVTPSMHPLIRSEEACYASSARAVDLAHKHNTRLHILHISTAKEVLLFEAKNLKDKKITSEVCVHHLWFSDRDYAEKGNYIKWNPSIKTEKDREALREGLRIGRVDIVATDHAPHTIEEKQGNYWNTPSGGPLVQHSLVAMMELSRNGVFTVNEVVRKMSHSVAELFDIDHRGFLREGYYADIVIVKDMPWVVTRDNVLSKCGWSPFEGQQFSYAVSHTIIGGEIVYQDGCLKEDFRGKQLKFNR